MDDSRHSSEDPIRLTHEELLSSEVDDFLSRQRSLTGQPLAGRDTGHKWYLQNWFLFGLAGAIAAFIVWAIAEPRFDDYFYVRGEIEDSGLFDTMAGDTKYLLESNGVGAAGGGWVKVNGETIWLSDWLLEYRQGKTYIVEPEDLRLDRDIGLYVQYYPITSGEGIAIAHYVTLEHDRPASAKSQMSLSDHERRQNLWSFILFPLLAGAIGLAIGAIEGIVCRAWRRAALSGVIGLMVGLLGGMIAEFAVGILYALVEEVAGIGPDGIDISTSLGVMAQILQRATMWACIGMAMGLGQGIALRSKRLLLYGFMGGVVGGLLGGMLFDPIDFYIVGIQKPSAHWSRAIGFTLIGLSVGVFIGIVQILARDFWLRMTHGPLAGKEFLFFKDTMTVGSSPRCSIYLFNDDQVQPEHAILRTLGDTCEIEALSNSHPVYVNDRSHTRARLNHGDQVTIGRTSFVYQMKQG